MAKAKKFGFFAGVFTPSILTILGVIMYLRLGWVVGEGGLYVAIAIILVAHVISVSTGLSVSSVSTDRKVKAGGLYYILSRSLGLPIGGAIGITLFVGTALSIALYVIGFAESFLDFWGLASGFRINEQTLEAMSQYNEEIIRRLSQMMGMPVMTKGQFLAKLQTVLQAGGEDYYKEAVINAVLESSRAVTVNDLRLTGTITALSVATIAFISTSFAIKTQFFILAAIALSLVSIFLGTQEFAPTTLQLTPPEGGASFSEIFGIFFPAVTGFTAGVAMSGDLKDPKKTIPLGTMLAIGVGLLVYIALAIFLAFSVDSTLLRSNNNILRDLALSPEAVLMGIWGATLSSALGGILGAPRILQAMSVDRITPKVFGKGVGKNNEPRNALILTFLIAEVGILIGELNTIAEVVSMFYLAAYGFINFSCFLESWASSDFRPQFRIPRFVSILGTISIIIVMAGLNLSAMIMAILIIGVIFLYLVRKQIYSGSEDGDVWEGVWTSVIRRGLFYVVKNDTQTRNWRPNIILFSGGARARPHLIDLGKSITGGLGFLSNFQLVEREASPVSFSKPQQLVPETEENAVGFFTRRQECLDIYEGMETIARTYGFSGLDPNTVLLGWGSEAKDPLRYVSSVYTMIRLDYNVLMLNYHRQFGFGKKERIDIWWRPDEYSIDFTFKLIQFIQKSEEWRKSQVRWLVLNEDPLSRNKVYRYATQTLEEMRIDAEIKMLNYHEESRTLNEMIGAESSRADLVILGLPAIEPGYEEAFLERRKAITTDIDKSILLLKSSSYFNQKSQELTPKSLQTVSPSLSLEHLHIPEVTLPESSALAEHVSDLNQDLERVIIEYNKKFLEKNYLNHQQVLESLRDAVLKYYAKISTHFEPEELEQHRSLIKQVHLEFLREFQELVTEFKNNTLPEEKEYFSEGNQWLYQQIEKIISNRPARLNIYYDLDFFQQDEQHEAYLKKFSWWKRSRIKSSHQYVVYPFRYQALLNTSLGTMTNQALLEICKNFSRGNIEYSTNLQKLLNSFHNSFLSLEKELSDPEQFLEQLTKEKERNQQIIRETRSTNEYWYSNYNRTLLFEAHRSLQEISQSLNEFEVKSYLRQHRRRLGEAKQMKQTIEEAPEAWLHNQSLVSNVALIEVQSLIFIRRFKNAVQQMLEEANNAIDDQVLRLLVRMEDYLSNFNAEESLQTKPYEFRRLDITENEKLFKELTDRYLIEIKQLIRALPNHVEMISEESINSLESNQFEELESAPVSLERLFDYLIQSHFIQPVLQNTNGLPRKFQKVNNVVQDVNQMLSSQVSRYKSLDEAEEQAVFIQQLQLKIDEQISKVQQEKKEILDIQRQLVSVVSKSLEETLVEFSPYAISKSAKNLEQYIRSKPGEKALSRFGRLSSQARENTADLFIKLWYRQSEGKTLAKNLQQNHQVHESRVEDLLNLVEKISPAREVLEKLPLFYQQLFFYKQNFGSEFWFGREKELQQAEKAIERFQDRLGGALLITGEYNSGRSFMAQYIDEKHFFPQYIYHIHPPEEGCISPRRFRKILQDHLEVEGDYEDIFDELPLNSVMIFDDIELWWERSPKGFAVIQEILHLIDEYGGQVFFILNTNIHSFRFMNMIQKIDSAFLGIIECSAMNVESLKEAILFRHRSSPITLEYKKTPESEMTEWKYARLLSKYYEYAQGNIGVALQSWISNIETIEDDVLLIREPRKPNLKSLRQLPDAWMILLVQLILHKHLTLERLARITQEEKATVDRQLKILKRSGLIREKENRVFQIDPFIEPHLVNELLAMGLL